MYCNRLLLNITIEHDPRLPEYCNKLNSSSFFDIHPMMLHLPAPENQKKEEHKIH